ncbi:MAG TPA: sugar ABC transporter permease [Pseudolysinimonas sp.]|nr:sugar ABC transporter permease [Pseudolysinimonas sp.]
MLLVLFLIWPIVTSVRYSFTSASGFGDMEFVGGANYARALSDGDFWASVGRNVIFGVIVLVSSVAIGFMAAYLLFLRVRGWRHLQLILMIPYIMPVVVTGLLWRFILEPQAGLVNTALRNIGLGFLAGPWLSGQSTALGSVSIVQAWVTIPLAMLLIFGAMISIPGEVIEAADLDGAGHLTKMVRIVFPMIRPTVILVSLLITLQLFRSFDLVYVLTQGGPIGSTTIATLYVFVQGFLNNEYGYANAVGIVLGLMLVVLAFIPRIYARRANKRQAGLELND